MSSASRVTVPWTVLLVGGLALLAAGAGATYMGLRSSASRSQPTVDREGVAGPASARRACRRRPLVRRDVVGAASGCRGPAQQAGR